MHLRRRVKLTKISIKLLLKKLSFTDVFNNDFSQATDEETYQYARRFVIAENQAIGYREYLPALLGGDHHIPKYTGYKPNVRSTVSNEFTTAAFR